MEFLLLLEAVLGPEDILVNKIGKELAFMGLIFW
jgi:hypothetical protein